MPVFHTTKVGNIPTVTLPTVTLLMKEESLGLSFRSSIWPCKWVDLFIFWARLEVPIRLRNFLWSIQSLSTWTLKSPKMMKEEVRDDSKPKKKGNHQERQRNMNLALKKRKKMPMQE